MDEPLLGRVWRLGLSAGVSPREMAGTCPPALSVFQEDLSVLTCKLIRGCNLRQQLGNYAIRSPPWRNEEVSE